MRKFTMVAIALLALASCTKNQRAKRIGGNQTVKLAPNEKFVSIIWKNDDLWIIIQDTITGNYYAREKSSYGILEGKIVIQK